MALVRYVRCTVCAYIIASDDREFADDVKRTMNCSKTSVVRYSDDLERAAVQDLTLGASKNAEPLHRQSYGVY